MKENVRAMRLGGIEAEGLLRDALSQCAEMRARGKTPYLVVLLGEDEHLPQLGLTKMLSVELLACAMRVHQAADDSMRELYEEDSDSVSE